MYMSYERFTYRYEYVYFTYSYLAMLQLVFENLYFFYSYCIWFFCIIYLETKYSFNSKDSKMFDYKQFNLV